MISGYRSEVDDSLAMSSISGWCGLHRRLLEVPGATVAHLVLGTPKSSALS